MIGRFCAVIRLICPHFTLQKPCSCAANSTGYGTASCDAHDHPPAAARSQDGGIRTRADLQPTRAAALRGRSTSVWCSSPNQLIPTTAPLTLGRVTSAESPISNALMSGGTRRSDWIAMPLNDSTYDTILQWRLPPGCRGSVRSITRRMLRIRL